MEFRLLGPLEARDGDSRIELGGPKQRALLARLLLDANRTVSVDRLVEDLWGENAPDSAAKMVQIHVSQLRKVLPPEMLVTRPPGYAVELDPEALDVVRFRRLHEEGACCSRAATPPARERGSPGRSICGAARRWPSSATRSPPSRQRAWRSCG